MVVLTGRFFPCPDWSARARDSHSDLKLVTRMLDDGDISC